ncbi:MAG: hypothetical protein RLZZ15_3985 [Verrucomicrobiota bacterium]
MKSFRLLVALALSGAPRAGRAAAADEPDVSSVLQIAAEGKYEIAIRAVDRLMTRYPASERLVELRTKFAEALARSRGNAGAKVAVTAAIRLPAIEHRGADAGRDFTSGTAEIAMVWIAPGAFVMSAVAGSDDDTRVTISKGFWLGRTEVTQEQWRAVIENVPLPSLFKGSDRPVERVSWVLAMEFGRKVTERERAAGRLPAGYEYTLPTEAQWEYACRAGRTGPFAGDVEAMAWFETNSGGQTHPVGQKRPNAWGLYDMHGNVPEWCADGYGGYPGGAVTDPMNDYSGPSAGTSRIIRGGGWDSAAGQCRSAGRWWQALNSSSVGFRLALAPVRGGGAAASGAR